ncbi:hypothetical protein NDU88_000493 [Pleurodeles waltl]|uniref:Uncharacterized protein n=1 Tax=Pleurodeles waltl TaxID=8319 RepID=A0AAV7NBH8_PLEWA|nr:hypothetical protein NDU88_000493 [Pleurodeles waltl]
MPPASRTRDRAASAGGRAARTRGLGALGAHRCDCGWLCAPLRALLVWFAGGLRVPCSPLRSRSALAPAHADLTRNRNRRGAAFRLPALPLKLIQWLAGSRKRRSHGNLL